MSGLPDHNYPAFHRAADVLRSKGFRVYNPAEFPHDGAPEDFPIRIAFAAYANFICLEADTLVLLPGWEPSKGVRAEKALAENCRLRIIEYLELPL